MVGFIKLFLYILCVNSVPHAQDYKGGKILSHAVIPLCSLSERVLLRVLMSP